MAGLGNFGAAAKIDLSDVFASTLAKNHSAPRQVWDPTFAPVETLDIGMPK